MVAADGTCLIESENPIPFDNPYITEGLISMWDGEWNSGGGTHESSISYWKDIVGGFDIQIPSSGYWSVGEKSLDLLMVYHTQNGNKLTLPQDSYSLNRFTFEIVSSRFVDERDSEFGIDHSGMLFLLEAYSATTVRARTWNATNTLYINAAKNIGDTSMPFTMSITYDGSVAIIYVNGTQLARATQTFPPFNSVAAMRIGCLYLYGYGSIYNIRVYSRSLDSDEIDANYIIDRERFNLQ